MFSIGVQMFESRFNVFGLQIFAARHYFRCLSVCPSLSSCDSTQHAMSSSDTPSPSNTPLGIPSRSCEIHFDTVHIHMPHRPLPPPPFLYKVAAESSSVCSQHRPALITSNFSPSSFSSQCARSCLKAWWRSWDPPPVRPPTPSSATSAERRR